VNLFKDDIVRCLRHLDDMVARHIRDAYNGVNHARAMPKHTDEAMAARLWERLDEVARDLGDLGMLDDTRRLLTSQLIALADPTIMHVPSDTWRAEG
jgi:transposase